MTHSSSMLETGKSLPPSVCGQEPLAQSSHLSTSSSDNKATGAWGGRPLNPGRSAAISEYAGPEFLDVGCGNGQYVQHFCSSHVTAGIDIQSYPQWADSPEKFQIADAAELPFLTGSFSTVVSFETLEHVPDPESVLREFHRVCHKNIIISVPNCELPPAMEASRLAFFHYTDRSHVNFFTPDSLALMLRKTGFEPTQVKLINHCVIQPLLNELLPLPSLLTGLLGRIAKRDAFPMTILAVAQRS